MILKHNDKIFYCESSYSEKDIPKSAGFRWHPQDRHWWTSDTYIASKLIGYADDNARSRLSKYENNKQKTIEASRAVNVDIDIPVPEGLEYMGFQKAGIAFAHDRTNILLGDQMGLGKTVQSIGLINLVSDIRKVLVICPASLKLNWKREAERWLARKFEIGIAYSKHLPLTANFLIMNYEIVKKHKNVLDQIEFDLLIVDECHLLKNSKSQRSQVVLGKKERKQGKWDWKHKPIAAKRKLFLTGTPIGNRPIELWTLIHALDPQTWSNFMAFAKRYCGAEQGSYGWDFSGARNLPELQERLRSTIMIRRLKEEVLTELPSKRRQIIELPANGCKAVIDRERREWQAHQDNLEELRSAVEVAKTDSDEAYQEAVKALKTATQIAFTEIARLRHETAIAKIPAVIEHLEDAIEEGKVVCFAHHKAVIRAIQDKFGGAAVSLTGDHTIEQRQEAIDRFQNNASVKLFIGSIQAAGVGITLTASSHAIFAELDWVPGNVSQAEDRCHRIGQKNSVLVQHLVLEASLDATMAKTIVKKQDIIDRALDKEGKVEPVIPHEPRQSPTRSKIEELAVEISDHEIASIHANLKLLSSLCDGANALDGMGFNKIDARTGHDLAARAQLTKKQAALGKILCRKYRRQLEQY